MYGRFEDDRIFNDRFIAMLLEVCRWKNFENRSMCDEVMAKKLGGVLFWLTMYTQLCVCYTMTLKCGVLIKFHFTITVRDGDDHYADVVLKLYVRRAVSLRQLIFWISHYDRLLIVFIRQICMEAQCKVTKTQKKKNFTMRSMSICIVQMANWIW